MAFQYDKLRGRIREICGTDLMFAKLIGISNTTLSAKLNNKSEFSQPEILKAVEILKLDKADIPKYYFCPKSLEN